MGRWGDRETRGQGDEGTEVSSASILLAIYMTSLYMTSEQDARTT